MAASSFGIGVPLAHFIETSRGHGAEAMTTHFLRMAKPSPAQRCAKGVYRDWPYRAGAPTDKTRDQPDTEGTMRKSSR